MTQSEWDKDGHDYCEQESYELLQIALSDQYEAVYVDADTNTLRGDRIDGLALARVCIRIFWRPQDSGKPFRAIGQEPRYENQIVGIHLCDGWFEPVENEANFAGLRRLDQPIGECIGMLGGEFRQRLTEQQIQASGRPVVTIAKAKPE